MSNKEIIEALNKESLAAWYQWSNLQLPLFDKEYSEDFEDTMDRLYLHGRYEALQEALELVKGLSL